MSADPEHVNGSGLEKNFEYWSTMFTTLDQDLTNDVWIPVVNELREKCPVFHSNAHEEDGFYVLTRYDDVMFAHRHPEMYSSCSVTIPPNGLARPWIPIESDPPLHKKYRAILSQYLSAKALAPSEPRYREIFTELLDKVASRGECDVMQEVLLPFPQTIIMDTFNFATEDREHLKDVFTTFAHKPSAMEDPVEAQKLVEAAANELYGYFANLVNERRENPGDDMLSILCTAEIDGEMLEDYEIIDYALLMVPAGFETTAFSLSWVFRYLAKHPEIRLELVRDTSLIPGFIEELLRFETPVKGLGRTVVVDHEVNGVQLRRGDRVCLLWGAANHDPRTFPNPEEFVIDRKPNRHLGFGGGSHVCSGIYMARLSMKVALEEWLSRVPDFVLGEGAEEKTGTTWSVWHLPLLWDTRAEAA